MGRNAVSRLRRALLVGALLVLTLVGTRRAPAAAVAAPAGALRAGVATVDATWHVGASSGQYADAEDPSDPESLIRSEWDPNFQHILKQSSYGVQSRLSIRALVLEGADGTRVALVKIDNYLAQDYLTRRVGQLLDADATSGVHYEHVLLSATHDHSSPYYSTPSAGVWVFQDVFDLRMFEYQARGVASAIEEAAAGLRPARLGATTVDFRAMQANIVGPQIGDDGSPAGYPLTENDHGLVVVRVDDMSQPSVPVPLATWVNFGEHPESLDGYSLESADYLAPLQRDVERDTGSTLVFTQGSVGSAEGPYEHSFDAGAIPVLPDGTLRAFGHAGYAQAERGARLMADAIVEGWRTLGDMGGQVPMRTDVPVAMLTSWVPGPVSHPYPSVSNCRAQPSIDGDPGAPILGLPDCQRTGTGVQSPLYENLVAAGIPLPANYDAPAFGAIEENLRIKLQAVRLGDVVLLSCSCEPQSDLVLNLESRTDKLEGNIFDGYDYASSCRTAADGAHDCPDPRDRHGVASLHVSDAAFQRMVAEVHNDAAGWDNLSAAAVAGSEPADPAAIKGNFTKTELPTSLGYVLPVGLGHTGDYDGYTVSYREYQNRDSYRKALTSYGPHTADYMNTRLLAMAGFLHGGPALAPEPLAAQGEVDEVRQEAAALALGQLSSSVYEGWAASLPDDVGPVTALEQPVSLSRFGAATFTWRGGGNYVDNPTAAVQRLVDGMWVPYADMSGEVQTMLAVPPGGAALLDAATGGQEWRWTASFEAFDAFPRHDVAGGQVPDGTYRFTVDGASHRGGAVVPYHLESDAFTVSPWEGIATSDPTLDPGGAMTFTIDPIVYPRSYASPFPFVKDDAASDAICRRCTFRPWASVGEVADVTVTVRRVADRAVLRRVPAERGDDGRWHAAVALVAGEVALVDRGDVRDAYGEINGRPTAEVGPAGSGSTGSSAGADRLLPVTGTEAGTTLIAAAALAALGLGIRRLPRRRRDHSVT